MSNENKRNKGNSLLIFPDEFIVLDTETTGYDPNYDEIIEIAAIRVKNDEIVDQFSTLVKPQEEISVFTQQLTGITNEMLRDAMDPEDAIKMFLNFAGKDILVAHNAPFDINFLYDYSFRFFAVELSNDFLCTYRFSRRAFPDLPNYKLSTLSEIFKICKPSHRSMPDVLAAWDLFKVCREHVTKNDIFDKFSTISKKSSQKIDISCLMPESKDIDPDNPAYGKTFVFTGTLSKMKREDAMQIVINHGGTCKNSTTKDTQYLVMGIQDYSRFADGEKSNKIKKAEELILRGAELSIISEDVFYDMVFN